MRQILTQFLVLMAFWGLPLSSARAVEVVDLEIDGMIHIGTVAVIEEGLRQAKASGAEAFLIRLDTPGGLLDSTRDIVKLMLNAEVPVIVYVSPSGAHAGSAGTFITMAAHVAAMAPGTNIGAATPVSVTGKDPEKDGGEKLAKKIEKDTTAFIESIARQRKRNIEWAKKAVMEADSIGDDKALKIGVIDIVAKDVSDLLAQANGKAVEVKAGTKVLKTLGARLIPLELDTGLKVKNWLANPTIMFLLILIAGLGLYMEFSNPGLIFPGVAAGVAIILLGIATSILPLSIIAIGLITLAFVLLIMEVYTTSFGFLAVGGIISFAIGAYILFDPSETNIRVPMPLIIGSTLALAMIAFIVIVAIGRTFGAKQTAGQEGLVGKIGKVKTAISPSAEGKIFVNGEYWNATAIESLEKGEKVEVVKVEGLLAHVRRPTETSNS